jgi:uncharacterized protein
MTGRRRARLVLLRMLGMLGMLGMGAGPACGSESRAPAPVHPLEASDDADRVVGEQAASELATFIAEHYEKQTARVPMRDGVRLFTTIYTPKGRVEPAPILMHRTPYGTGPYEPEAMPDKLAPSEVLTRRKWIIVQQDVRGRFMSEGEFVDMRPHLAKKSGPNDVDESTDTYDTISWLLENVEGHNGKVGQWGNSYPGFYAAAGMIDAHPALVAVSPQAPIADWFFDDFHHHGAFFLPHAFNFFASFGQPRTGPTTEWPERFAHGTDDGYAFFLDLGPLRNANERHFRGEIAAWNDLVAHPNYDTFWQARNLLPHLQRVAPAVMTVGGWFDAEDLYGPLNIYRSIEDQNPDVFNILVMGPWRHGGWFRTDGRRLGDIDFGAQTAVYYQQEIEAPFFMHWLEDGPRPDLPEVLAFETGVDRWRRFSAWPPPDVQSRSLYLGRGGTLTDRPPTPKDRLAYDEYVSDPARPVPFTASIGIGMNAEYMVEDQRFAARRPDVLVYATDPLTEAQTLAGPITARLWVSTTGSDADFVVKIIDVFPKDAVMPAAEEGADPVPFGEYQMMVRSEIIRARFRGGYEHPKPLRPGVPTEIELPLQSVLHTFRPGHRIMIHIQSTWFPMVDRNPQRFVENIFLADESDFISARHRVWRSPKHPTRLEVGLLPPTDAPE